jgi:predicted nucleic acid-binding protein
MRKIFLDANIIIDLVNAGNKSHTDCLFLFNELVKQGLKLYVSPTTFAITYYFLNKNIKDSAKLNRAVVKLFTNFIFTREDDVIMNKVLKSSFIDLEDALQYYSALDCGADLIISYNQHDFIYSSIPVYHPLHYISEFLL